MINSMSQLLNGWRTKPIWAVIQQVFAFINTQLVENLNFLASIEKKNTFSFQVTVYSKAVMTEW